MAATLQDNLKTSSTTDVSLHSFLDLLMMLVRINQRYKKIIKLGQTFLSVHHEQHR